MVLSKRERWIAIGTVSAIVLFGTDRLVVSPLLERKDELDAKIATAQQDKAKNDHLFVSRNRLTKEWNQLAGKGLPPDETRVLQDLGRWAQESGMSLPTVNPSRPEHEKDFYKITIRLTGTGGMAQIGRFLYRIETAPEPLRVTDVTITSRREGTDDLQLTMGVSTIYPTLEAERKVSAAASVTARGEDL